MMNRKLRIDPVIGFGLPKRMNDSNCEIGTKEVHFCRYNGLGFLAIFSKYMINQQLMFNVKIIQDSQRFRSHLGANRTKKIHKENK